MNRTVENGKTLLVDGPASVIVTSGRVDVFGFIAGNTNKVIIREGKRLPFSVEEKANFEISLGESANMEEVDGRTIPLSWIKSIEVLLEIHPKPLTIIVIGGVDSGKTSFCTYLVNRLINEKQKVAILDGDLGQSDIGPPCTVAYALVRKPITDLFDLEAENAFFVGATSPSTSISKVIEGLTSLKSETLKSNPDCIVINTDGWVEGEEAVDYKAQLVKELSPDIVFCIQREDELEPFLNTLKIPAKVVDSPSAIKQRSRESRRSLRELGYVKYLRNAKVQSLPLSRLKVEENELLGLNKKQENIKQAERIYELLGMKPLHLAEQKGKIYIVFSRRRWINKDSIKKVEEFSNKKAVIARKGEEEGLLVALYSAERRFLGIGVLQEIDYARKTLKILTPVSKEMSIVALGKVKLDRNLKEVPAFFEENSLESFEIKKF